MTGRQRFLNACHCQPVGRPPVWLMRQAGRALPEYRALKERHSFLELVRTPELAAEVTLQPIRRFGFDAAILFSDILVVPEAMGQGYQFKDQGGLQMDFLIRSEADIDKLESSRVRDGLQYVAQALKLLKRELSDQTALLGFAGSPWTLANFMLEGGSAKEYTRAKVMYYTEPKLFHRLMEKLTTAVTQYLHMQIEAGADAIQIFDSSSGLLADHAFEQASASWMRTIIGGLGGKVPVIVFCKGTHGQWDTLGALGANIVGVDWTVDIAGVRTALPEKVGVQGNLDPALLQTTPETVATETSRILESMRDKTGHIFNLGHGVPPTAKLENIESLVQTVRSFS